MLTLLFLFKTIFTQLCHQKLCFPSKSVPPAWVEYLSRTFLSSFEQISASPSLSEITNLLKKCNNFQHLFACLENVFLTHNSSEPFRLVQKVLHPLESNISHGSFCPVLSKSRPHLARARSRICWKNATSSNICLLVRKLYSWLAIQANLSGDLFQTSK